MGAARLLVLVFLAAATFLAFAGVLGNGWVLFDDPAYVYDNPHVNRGLTLDGVLWYLHEPQHGNWHPLTSYSHMLDVRLFGLDPAGHHAMSLALHIVNALVLALVLYRLTGAWWRSVLVAAFFALHPLRVESVAWASERKDVLSGLFFLLALECHRGWVAHPFRSRYGLLVAVSALGLMAKPMLVTLPLVLVLLDVWPLNRLAGMAPRPAPPPGTGAPARTMAALIAEKWPLLLLAAAAGVIAFFAQRQSGAVVSVATVPFELRIINVLVSVWRYVRMILWPSDLAVFYPYDRGLGIVAGSAAAVGIAAVTVFALRQRRQRPYLAVGWLWYLGMLLPVIGLVQVGGQAYADRYTYLPAIGLSIALVWGVGDLVQRSRIARAVTTVACAVGLAALAFATARQVAYWRDTRTLFAQAVAVTRPNPLAHQFLGLALLQSGDAQGALAQFEEEVRLDPGSSEAHSRLGSALGAAGRYDEAVAQFAAALQERESAAAHYNLGFTLVQQGRTDEAIREFEAALRSEPDHFDAHVQLGAVLGGRGRLQESEVHLRRAVELRPAAAEARRMLAVGFTIQGRVEDAIGEYREILRAHPDDLDALCQVAWIRATHRDADHRNGAEAVALAERARDKAPQPVAGIFATVAAAYAEAGRFPEAVRAGERAVELAKGSGATDEAERYARQLEGYRAGRAFHFQ